MDLRPLIAVLAPFAALTALTALAGCSDYQWFRPRERVIGESPDGTPAASFVFSDHHAAVLLWSRGGGRDPAGAFELQIGFQLPADGPGTLLLGADPRIALTTRGGERHDRIAPAARDEELVALTIPVRRILLSFPLPVAPREVESFALRWNAEAADGTVFPQLTPFRPCPLTVHDVYLENRQFWTDVEPGGDR